MPKIDVNEQLFFKLLGKQYDYSPEFEHLLSSAKAELDEAPSAATPKSERIIKIELNDTNRPDLWSTAGLARLLRMHTGGASNKSDYQAFLSTLTERKDSGHRTIIVDPELQGVRPFMTAFVISGKPIDEPMLKDIIQTQEKLCWNFGRKRRSISMGVYRSELINWPVHYRAVDPHTTSFTPLGFDTEMTCERIISEHPKGKEYGWILKGMKKVPLLSDAKGGVLSMAPIINSAGIGAVQQGDTDLLVELTGTDMPSLLLATNIVACDFSDAGYTILPVSIEYPYETGFGKTITTPLYFQEPTKTTVHAVNKLLGTELSAQDIVEALERMDNTVTVEGDCLTLTPPAYRNDFLHEVDIIEDVMMGKTVEFFEPETPREFTIGRLSPVTVLSRKIKSLMVGFGYQEMIFNYLGSKKDYIDRMNIDGAAVIEIANPMSENYQFVRPSIIPSLLSAETVSGNAVYPHRIFETGKIAYLAPEENTGTRTRQSLGFLTVNQDANFNEAASLVAGLLYYLQMDYAVCETHDSRFIEGRQAGVLYEGKQIGIFGELHPQVLENWSVTVPAFAGELDIESILTIPNADR
ncbi:phenylalanine--tRNA ligase, beta subunit [Treponema vincentii ATCC 35580]|uniref:Phenylalanine--tRNA ligase beta subunit n=1 Tax=Treponema vincentii ATCC 35580 TaxID=596324 RepID=C8PP83_9SPIR|nr:phenylalanine--tRNA ligase subunit beta [Treponema vincentii]EEV20655.1 phenylalanine--tRNA ligase, beta subunit [Treponema vincentii ATCC 35580]